MCEVGPHNYHNRLLSSAANDKHNYKKRRFELYNIYGKEYNKATYQTQLRTGFSALHKIRSTRRINTAALSLRCHRSLALLINVNLDVYICVTLHYKINVGTLVCYLKQ